MKWGWLVSAEIQERACSNLVLLRTRRRLATANFKSRSVMKNSNRFVLVSTEQKIETMFFRVCPDANVANVYISYVVLVWLLSGVYVCVTLETVCRFLHTQLAIWIHVHLVRTQVLSMEPRCNGFLHHVEFTFPDWTDAPAVFMPNHPSWTPRSICGVRPVGIND